MTIDASDRTLGLINIWQVLRKLCWEVELLKAIPDKIRLGAHPTDVLHVQDAKIYAAINAASTNIALVDWLYHSISASDELVARTKDVLGEVRIDKDTNFLISMRKLYKPINVCHQICNSNKHFHLRKPEANFKIMVGEILMEHDDGSIDLSVVNHVVQNGDGRDSRGSIEDILKDSVVWWDTLLTRIGLPDREQFFPVGTHSSQVSAP